MAVPSLKIAECSLTDRTKSWSWFEYPGLQRLSAVDASSFVLMQRLKIRTAFAFDPHFAQAGFALLGGTRPADEGPLRGRWNKPPVVHYTACSR